VCIHGNRFIQWSVIKSLEIKLESDDNKILSSIKQIVPQNIKRIIEAVKRDFSDSYPASLFKNLSKCKELDRIVSEKIS
jgi:hypothetical protein